jgi:drug/metabolite transporter (DMT)-like permease
MYSNLLGRVHHSVYLWTAVLIFAASNAVTRKLTEIGAQHLVDGRNPISLCNVLFAGNLCAFVMLLLLFGKEWNQRTIGQLTRSDWLSLGAIAILSGALAPGLIFAALDKTTVTNVVLVGRLEPPLTLALSILLLKSQVNRWTIAGAAVSFSGVVVITFLTDSEQIVPMMGGFHIGQGELLAVVGALVLAIATTISKLYLQHIHLGVFSLVRTGVGTAVFFVLARTLYGSQHFVDIFSPFLWKWMLLYGSMIVVIGQLCWFAGLRGSTAAESTLANSVNPVGAIAMAYLILGEVPTSAQYMGGLIIFIGIILSMIGNLRDSQSRKRLTQVTPAQDMEMAIGFRGI